MTGQLWLTMSGIIFLATFIQVLTGFGFGLIAVPLLLFILPSQEALLAGMLLSMLSSFLQVVNMRHIARWDLVIRLVLLSIPGVFIGVALSGYMNELYIKGVVGIVLVAYVFYQWLYTKDETQAGEAELLKGSDVLKEKVVLPKREIASPKVFFLVAFSSGLLNGLAAIPGPPIVALLIKHLKKDVFQGTTVSFFFCQYFITSTSKIIVFRGAFDSSFGLLLLSMVLAILLGYWMGNPVRERINEVQFKKLVYVLLFVIGLTSIGQTLLGLLL